MFGKRDIIDEMDDARVDEMDNNVIDDTVSADHSDYFDSSRYYDPSRYEKDYDKAHDSHLCEEGHDHDESDRRRSASYSQSREKVHQGGHLCEDGESHEYGGAKSEAWKRFEEKHGSKNGSYASTHQKKGEEFTAVTDYSPRSPKKVYIDRTTYNKPDDAKDNRAGLAVVGIVLIVFGIASANPVLILIGVSVLIALNKKKNSGSNSGFGTKASADDRSDYEKRAASTTLKVIAVMIFLMIAVIFLIIAFSTNSSFTEFAEMMEELD